jgi:hypothetical protein
MKFVEKGQVMPVISVILDPSRTMFTGKLNPTNLERLEKISKEIPGDVLIRLMAESTTSVGKPEYEEANMRFFGYSFAGVGAVNIPWINVHVCIKPKDLVDQKYVDLLSCNYSNLLATYLAAPKFNKPFLRVVVESGQYGSVSKRNVPK